MESHTTYLYTDCNFTNQTMSSRDIDLALLDLEEQIDKVGDSFEADSLVRKVCLPSQLYLEILKLTEIFDRVNRTVPTQNHRLRKYVDLQLKTMNILKRGLLDVYTKFYYDVTVFRPTV